MTASGDGAPPGRDGSAEEVDYVRAVEERFRQLRERPLILSPGDLARVVAWFRRGVPLFLVLDTLEEVFRQAAERRPARTPRSLAYVEPAVEQAERDWREALVGRRSDPSTPVESGALSARAREALSRSEAPSELVERIGRQLAGRVSSTIPVEEVAALQRELIEACAATLSLAERQELDRETERLLGPYAGGMDHAVRERTRVALRDRLLRRRFRLPDLTLLALSDAPIPGSGDTPPAR